MHLFVTGLKHCIAGNGEPCKGVPSHGSVTSDMLKALNAALQALPTAFRAHQKTLGSFATSLLAAPWLHGAVRCGAALLYSLLPRLTGMLQNNLFTGIFELIVLVRYLLCVPKPQSCEPTCTDMRHKIARYASYDNIQLGLTAHRLSHQPAMNCCFWCCIVAFCILGEVCLLPRYIRMLLDLL